MDASHQSRVYLAMKWAGHLSIHPIIIKQGRSLHGLEHPYKKTLHGLDIDTNITFSFFCVKKAICNEQDGDPDVYPKSLGRAF